MAPTYFRNVSGLLLAFVVLSLLAHGVTLLFDAEPVIPLNKHRFGATIISTVLMPAKDQPAAQPSNNSVSASQPETHTNKKQQLETIATSQASAKVSKISTSEKTELETTPYTDPEAESLNPHDEPSTVPEKKLITAEKVLSKDITPPSTKLVANQREQQRNYLLGKLQNRLNRYLTYPIRARRRGWQGEVIVAFHIDEQGQLNNVHLIKSSGHSLLDRSAVTAITKLHYIDLPDSMGRLQAMELQLPVRYQLRES